MRTQRKATRSIRQSVTIPASLAPEVRRVAEERRLTIGRALVSLAERGLRAEAEAREQLEAAHSRFLNETDSARKEEAGKDLIRSIFGTDAFAEDPIR